MGSVISATYPISSPQLSCHMYPSTQYTEPAKPQVPDWAGVLECCQGELVDEDNVDAVCTRDGFTL